MKKHFLAAAVATAFAVPAVAQNVTIYGVLDAGLMNQSNGTAAGGGTTLLGSGLHTTSRLGFRGTEDLGGGMSVRWTLEAGLAHDAGVIGTGSVSSAQYSATTPASINVGPHKVFERQATVGIVQGAFSADFGRQNNLTAATAAIVDPQGFVFTGLGPNVALIGLGALPGSNGYGPTSQSACTSMTGTTALNLGNCANMFRFDNSIRANFTQAGWTVSGMTSFGEIAGDSSARTSQGAAVNGKLGMATVAAAMTKVEGQNTNNSLRSTIIGASVPLGNFTVRVSSGKVTADDRAVGNTSVNGIGLDIPMSNAAVLTLSYFDVSNDSTTAANAGGFKQTGAIYNYSLSKRSGLYAAAFMRDFEGSTADASYFRATTLKQNDTTYSLGMRHSF